MARRDQQIRKLKAQKNQVISERDNLMNTRDAVAKQAALDSYLPNFSDEELQRLGTSRQAITDYVMNNNLTPENVVQLLQSMGLDNPQQTQEEKAEMEALQFLINLAEENA